MKELEIFNSICSRIKEIVSVKLTVAQLGNLIWFTGFLQRGSLLPLFLTYMWHQPQCNVLIVNSWNGLSVYSIQEQLGRHYNWWSSALSAKYLQIPAPAVLNLIITQYELAIHNIPASPPTPHNCNFTYMYFSDCEALRDILKERRTMQWKCTFSFSLLHHQISGFHANDNEWSHTYHFLITTVSPPLQITTCCSEIDISAVGILIAPNSSLLSCSSILCPLYGHYNLICLSCTLWFSWIQGIRLFYNG